MTNRIVNRSTFETRLVQALHATDDQTGAVVPGIEPAATYARDEDYQIRQPYWYRRDGNRTSVHAEALIAMLEGAEETLLFASGLSAASAVIDQLEAGAHLVVPEVAYHGVLAQAQRAAAAQRITLSSYKAGDLDSLQAAVRPGHTALVWVETPNNPTWEVTDIAAAGQIARDAGAKLIADCTATPPSMTRALDLGADISFHSATKYLNGHSDVTAGALSTRVTDASWQAIQTIRKLQGTVLQSFDAWLLIRGMRTLYLRVDKASANAMALAQHFDGDDRLEAVLYPGLPSHPGHQVAAHQTEGLFGAMLSVIVKGSEQTAIDVCRHCHVFYPATSLGGVESLIEHRKTVSGDGFPVHPQLLRLSVGIESASDLIADLDQALDQAQA